MATVDVCAAFGVGQSTAAAKAGSSGRAERPPHGPDLDAAEPDHQNPLVWMAEVNGLLVDLRDMPREVNRLRQGHDPLHPGRPRRGPGVGHALLIASR